MDQEPVEEPTESLDSSTDNLEMPSTQPGGSSYSAGLVVSNDLQPDNRFSLKNRFSNISPRTVMVMSAIITLIVLLITSLAVLLFTNDQGENTASTVPTQDVDLSGPSAIDSEIFSGTERALFVNGDIIADGTLSVSDSGQVIVIQPASLSEDQTITLPNSSGVVCLDSNNCNYITAQQLESQLGQIVIPTSTGVPASSLVNSQVGEVSIQGTSNRVLVSTNNGVIRLSTPQDLATVSSPNFANLVLSGNLNVGGNIILPLNCTTFLNGGALSTNANGRIICTDDETSGPGTSVTTPGGTPGVIPVFTAADVVEDSIISQALGTITIGGSLDVSTNVTFSNLANGFLRVNGSGSVSVNTIDLGTDTDGDYVVGLTADDGLSIGGVAGEGWTPSVSLSLQANKGLEVDGNGLSLIDCGNGQILKYETTGGTWACDTDGAGSGVTTVGTIDSQTKSADGAVIDSNTIYLQTADATNPGLVSTGAQTFGGAKTFNAQATFNAAGTGLSVTNDASIGGQLSLTTTGSSGGIIIGGDTNLYRSGANILATDDIFEIGTLGSADTDTVLCHNSSNQIATCSSTFASSADITLQNAYDTGNTILTTDARDIDITLANTTTDANFTIDIATGSTGELKVQNNGTDVLQIGSAGQLQLDVQGSSGGILIGDDVHLYRDSANRLRMGTDDSFRISNTQGDFLSLQSDASSVYIDATATSSSNWVFAGNRAGDTGKRFIIQADGTLNWDDGTGTGDTNLYRGAADRLETDSEFRLNDSPVSFIQTTSTDEILFSAASGDTNDRFTIDASGFMEWGDGTNTRDTNLYRSSSNTLRTDDNFVAGSDITIQGGDLFTTQTTFNLLEATATTINFGGAVGAGGINFAGGSGSTGCTIDGSNGNLTCSGNISTTATTGTQGWWSRSGTTLQPATAGDNITTSGNISTSGTGTITAAGILNANATGKTAITIADSGAQDSGITIGGDTNLYRDDAGVLATDGELAIYGGGLYIEGGDEHIISVQEQPWYIILTSYTDTGGSLGFQMQADGRMLWSGGGAPDTNLYRSAANTLTTDDTLTVGSNFGVSGGASITTSQTAAWTNLGTSNTSNILNLYDISDTLVGSVSDTGEVLFQNSTDSTTAFQVQTAAGDVLFNIDSTTRNVSLGDAFGSNVSLLVLDTKTTSGDPTGANGGMYYNSDAGKFRCYENGSWVDCIGATESYVTLQNAYDGGNTLLTTDGRDIDITLANTTTDANFTIDIATGSTGELKIQNNGTDVLQIGSAGQLQLDVQGSGGGILLGGDVHLYRTNSGATPILHSDAQFRVGQSSASNLAFVGLVGAESWARFSIQAGGTIEWGDGTTARDTNLYRSAADTLKTDDNFHIQTATNSTSAFQVQNAAGTADVFTVDTSNNEVEVEGTITVNGDTQINSNITVFTNTASTDKVFGTAQHSDTFERLRIYGDGLMEWGPGGVTARDTNLYRSAANTLKTDDNFHIQTATNSTTAFQVQNASASSLFTADTTNQTIGIGSSGTASDAKLYIATSNNGLRINQTGTSDLIQLQDGGTNVLTISDTGEALFQNSSNSTTAFQIQNASGNNIFNVSTTPITSTLVSQVNASSDDAEELISTGAVDLTSSDLELINDGGDQEVGMRFNDIYIPAGATITNAYIRFIVDEATSGATDIVFNAEDTDDASTFTTTNSDISNRTKTTATVNWNSVPAWNTVGASEETPNLSALVQEVVDRGGWSAGNSIAIIASPGTGSRVAESFDGSSSQAPVLVIEYTGNESGTATTSGNSLIQANSTTAFQVQNSAGDSIFNVDTTNSKVVINRLEFGGDAEAQLYRPQNNFIQASGQLAASWDIFSRFGDSGSVTIGQQGPSSEAGINFDGDTTLYRSSANNLSTGSGDNLDVNGSLQIDFLGGTASTNGVCHSGADIDGTGSGSDRTLLPCDNSAGDIAEWYEIAGHAEPGELLVTSSETFTYEATQTDPYTGTVKENKISKTISKLERSTSAYQNNVIGVISTSPVRTYGADIKEQGHNPHPIALKGRVPVKTTTDNGEIKPGDRLVASDKPGHVMKATGAGFTIGVALSSLSDGDGMVEIFVGLDWYDPTAGEEIQGGSNFENLFAQTANITNLNTIDINTEDLAVTDTATIANLIVTSSALFEGNITVEGHIVTAGDTPDYEVLEAVTGATVEIIGNDTSGTIVIETSADTIPGAVLKLLFAESFGSVPQVVISPSNDDAGGTQIYKSTASNNEVIFKTKDTLPAHKTLRYDYIILE